MSIFKTFTILLIILSLGSCQNTGKNGLTATEFRDLMHNVAIGWSTQDTELALSSFNEDVIYMEPPNIQYYRGHTQLRPYFDALEESHKMVFHNLWFDESTQTGSGEYTFSYGVEIADTGVVVVELNNGKISFWREYQQKGPSEFSKYIGIENKDWEWTIENYP